MYTYVLTAICTLLYILYISETYKMITEPIMKKYEKWKVLTSVVSSTENKRMYILWISMKLIIKTMYLNVVQYMNSTVRQLDRKTYEVSYVIEGKLYKMVVAPKRGPAPVIQISDDESNDITDHVLPYMGPNYDWHGNVFKPRFFGHKSLTFELLNGDEYTYDEDSQVEYNDKK